MVDYRTSTPPLVSDPRRRFFDPPARLLTINRLRSDGGERELAGPADRL